MPAPRPAQLARAALELHVRRSDDRRLERTVGSRPALRLALGALARRFDPDAAGGFVGALRVELATTTGALRTWTLVVGHRCVVTAGAGAAEEPDLVMRSSVADFVRLAAGELGPARALLTGRLDLAGDFGVARRVGSMFRMSSAL